MGADANVGLLARRPGGSRPTATVRLVRSRDPNSPRNLILVSIRPTLPPNHGAVAHAQSPRHEQEAEEAHDQDDHYDHSHNHSCDYAGEFSGAEAGGPLKPPGGVMSRVCPCVAMQRTKLSARISTPERYFLVMPSPFMAAVFDCLSLASFPGLPRPTCFVL